jgi:hypothetical protein
MTDVDRGSPIRLFSTFPPSTAVDPSSYLATAVEMARWSENAG